MRSSTCHPSDAASPAFSSAFRQRCSRVAATELLQDHFTMLKDNLMRGKTTRIWILGCVFSAKQLILETAMEVLARLL